MVASYSDSPGEPIKIWDLRKGAAAKPKLMVIQSQVIDISQKGSYRGYIWLYVAIGDLGLFVLLFSTL